MSKHEPYSPLAFGSTSENPAHQRRGDAELAGGQPVLGEVGFVGLGHMGTAMAANLAATGRRVIAYVRRPDQVGRLEALGAKREFQAHAWWVMSDPAGLLFCVIPDEPGTLHDQNAQRWD